MKNDTTEIKISEGEWKVMEALWDLGQARPLDIIEALEGDTEWNHRTIRTLLARLTKKGAVELIEKNGRNRYTASVTRNECLRTESKSFVQKFFGGDVQALLTHFVEAESLSPDQVEGLHALLESAAKPKRKPKNKSK